MQEEHQTEKEASGSLPGENTPEIGEAETSVRSEDAADKKSVWRRVIWPALKKFASRWFITGFGGMSQGLFATLIIGLIIKQLGKLIGEGTGGAERGMDHQYIAPGNSRLLEFFTQ